MTKTDNSFGRFTNLKKINEIRSTVIFSQLDCSFPWKTNLFVYPSSLPQFLLFFAFLCMLALKTPKKWFNKSLLTIL